MAKFTWQDGTLVSKAKVEIGGTIYEVDPEEYSGATPLSASNLNTMQDGIYEDMDEIDTKSRLVGIGKRTSYSQPLSNDLNIMPFENIDVINNQYIGVLNNSIRILKAGYYKFTINSRVGDGTGSALVGIAINGNINDNYGIWGYNNARLNITGTFILNLAVGDTVNLIMHGTGVSALGVDRADLHVEFMENVGG